MASATRRLLAGDYTPQSDGDGIWRLRGGAEPHWTLHLRGLRDVDRGESAPRTLEPGGAVEIDWDGQGAGAMLMLCAARSSVERPGRRLHARVAILHEAIPGLYADLPLADHDPGARRFWIRVMRIARVPGGGRLIGWIARRRAARAVASTRR